jgi:hypothetical protein
MTDLLITILISGIAITYTVEFLELVTLRYLQVSLLNKYFTLPLSFGALLSQYSLNKQFIIAVPATTFVAIAISKWLNKPTVVNRLPRL